MAINAQLLAAAAKAISAFTNVVSGAAQIIFQATKQTGPQSSGAATAFRKAAAVGLGRFWKALRRGAGIGGATKIGLRGAAKAFGGGVSFGLAAVATAAVAAGKQLEQMSVQARKFHQELSRVSPAMAAAEARRNVAIILRQREQGNRLAGAASALNEAEQQKEDAKKELGILEDRVKTALATFWEKVKAGFYAPFNDVAGKINKLIENTDPNRPLAADEWAQKMAEEDRKWRDDWHRRHDHWEPAGNDRGVPGMGVGGGDAFK